MFCNLMGMIACLATVYRNFYVILIARFFFGTAVGIGSGAGARVIEETVPPQLYGLFSPLTVVGYGFGTVFSFSLAYILPEDDDIQGLLDD